MTSNLQPAVLPRADHALIREEGIVAPTRLVPIVESLRDHRSIVGEEFRLLRAKVLALRQERSMRCVAVVSPLPGEGKSTVALGLATALAREPGSRILLVESDLRRPTISSGLGLSPRPGLVEWLNGSSSDVPVRLVDRGGFFLLGAGRAALERPEDLGSPRMDALLRASRNQFDMVVLDAAPVLPVADVMLLQDLVDGLLFVVRSRMTPRGAVLDAFRRIQSEKVVGVVLNDQREHRHSYMTYAYHGYDMRHGYEPAPRGSDGSGDRRRPKAGATHGE